MPIEIKELVIRAVIAPENRQDANTQAGARAESTTPEDVTERIVQECVRQVLSILQRERER